MYVLPLKYIKYGRRCFTTSRLFEKVLVANRGEIAIRIMKSCEKLGIRTVGVYSEADSRSLFVKKANEAICIGPAPSQQSYLNIEKVIDACKRTGAQAVHPGYGFLSEKYTFAEELEKNGITFIGPSKDSLYLMGDKIQSKTCAANANVNIVPGFDGNLRDADHAVDVSKEIGYPVMIKAAGGGGGKGMRVAYNDQEARDGFRLSLAEAISSFNDDRIFVEKFIEEPRHIEFQILGDKHGNIIHLNERECSIQRRNQKLLEEAPSPYLTPELRETMGKQAVSLARAAGYYSAGTVEFLIDKSGNFYFLEMNTRLQVEHPITEMITGVDIVEQMIRIAAGEKLSISQSDVSIDGWAIENRINSENPYRQLGIPSIGRIIKYKEPSTTDSVRVDSGIVEGSEISMYYDSLIAKCICHGKTRQQALELSRQALDRFVIRGVSHNISLLRDIMDNLDFSSGNFTTKYLQEKYPKGFEGKKLSNEEKRMIIAATCSRFIRDQLKNWSIDRELNSFEIKGLLKLIGSQEWFCHLGNEVYKIKFLDICTSQCIKVVIDDVEHHISIKSDDLDYTEISVDGNLVVYQLVSKIAHSYKMHLFGDSFNVKMMSRTDADISARVNRAEKDENIKNITSPMLGSVISCKFKVGDVVHVGDEVAVIEAMKMQNAIISDKTGKVKNVFVKEGGQIGDGEVIIEFE